MSLNASQSPAPLPRGRHDLSREDVLESQRSRLTYAMLRRVAEVGWSKTTVADVVAAARVSRNAFYDLFSDREDCFLAAAEELARETLATMYQQANAPSWLEALSQGLTLFLRSWQELPAFSRAYLVELPGAGARAQEQRDRTYAEFATMFEALAARARAEQPELPPLDPLTPRILVTAITELIAQEIRADRIGGLGRLHPSLFRLIVLLLANESTATKSSTGPTL